MNIDILQIGAVCVAITGAWGLLSKFQGKMLEPLKLMIENTKKTIDSNQETMESLQKSIDNLADGLKENQYNFQTSKTDRELLHKVQDHHETRIGIAEDEIIILKEQTKTLFKTKEDKK